MNKQEFLTELEKGLSGLPRAELDERLNFYSEMIDDRIEEGRTEEDAVNEIGPVGDVINDISRDIPLTTLVKAKVGGKKKLKGWEILLLVLGAPLWLPLLIAAFAVLFSLYIVLWALIISLYAVTISLFAGAFACLIKGVVLLFTGGAMTGLCYIGAALFAAGLGILLLLASAACTTGVIRMTKNMVLGFKKKLIRKER